VTQERRYARRHLCSFPVTLSGNEPESQTGIACDLSALGIGVSLHRSVVTALAQGGNIMTAGDLVAITLPVVAGTEFGGRPLAARVRHVRRLSQDEYLVGLLFNDTDALDDNSVDALVKAGA
jgi:hypothetical protein